MGGKKKLVRPDTEWMNGCRVLDSKHRGRIPYRFPPDPDQIRQAQRMFEALFPNNDDIPLEKTLSRKK